MLSSYYNKYITKTIQSQFKEVFFILNKTKNNDINIKDTIYTEEIVCKIEMEEDKKDNLLKDYALKNINLLNIQVLSKKYIEKSISK